MRFMCKHVAAVSQIIKYSTVRMSVNTAGLVKMTPKFLDGVSYRIFFPRPVAYKFIKIVRKKI